VSKIFRVQKYSSCNKVKTMALCNNRSVQWEPHEEDERIVVAKGSFVLKDQACGMWSGWRDTAVQVADCKLEETSERRDTEI